MASAWLAANWFTVLTKFGLMTTYFRVLSFGWRSLSMAIRAS